MLIVYCMRMVVQLNVMFFHEMKILPFHAGRYLDDKEICYHGTVIVTANVCLFYGVNTGHISVLKYKHLSLNLVYLLYSRLINIIVIPKLYKVDA